ncbi:hypothetical protein GCM10022403_060750 [Streptomyces coacervatus]|uniref:Secreted protein n=1 Tax=Streptomyces coacervatus TaxID=647381 RepID=A0ABP7II70_9ACTN|nr:hypothetical protein [Streptomyces coacervatus]MDF2269876.1 hypothetical protein [Streptomyces coacervatus]
MAANRRRTTAIATAVTAVVLTAGLVTGCNPDALDNSDNSNNSLDCARNYDTIVDSLKAIHEAGSAAASDPSRTGESIETIEKNLDKIGGKSGGKTDDSKVDKAVADLNQAVADYNKAVLNGENPDSRRIDKAADELKDVCAS